jgi:internalin A
VVLKRGENTALIKADTEDKKIYIWVSGKEDTRRDLLAIIRGEFDAIHNTIAKIEATEKVPLPNTPEATPVDYEFLLRLAKEGRELLPVQAGGQIVDLIVKEVLSRIETDTRKTEIHIHGNVENSNLLVGDKNRADNTNTKKK